MKRRELGRVGGVVGNLLLVVAFVALLMSVIWPRVADRAFTARVEEVVGDIERLRGAVTEVREATGTWPPTGPAEALAPGLATSDGGASPEEESTGVTWRRLDSVEIPPPSIGVADSVPEAFDEAEQELPAPVPEFYHRGAISVRSQDPALLGSLLERYEGSFVHDGVWTLVLPSVPAPAGP